jgi:hypothetical protein
MTAILIALFAMSTVVAFILTAHAYAIEGGANFCSPSLLLLLGFALF